MTQFSCENESQLSAPVHLRLHLLLEALVGLFAVHMTGSFGYRFVYVLIGRWPLLGLSRPKRCIEEIVEAVTEAAVWFPTRTYCLYRSAVVTLMLRMRGVPAKLVIGFRPVPLESHAWVEVEGAIVNDRPQYKKYFKVVDVY